LVEAPNDYTLLDIS